MSARNRKDYRQEQAPGSKPSRFIFGSLLGFLLLSLVLIFLVSSPATSQWVEWPSRWAIGFMQKTTAGDAREYLEVSDSNATHDPVTVENTASISLDLVSQHLTGDVNDAYITSLQPTTTVYTRSLLEKTNASEFRPELELSYIDVKDDPYGAVGSGAVSDIVALQAAVDAAIVAGKPLYLSSGVYAIDDALQIGDGLSIVSGFELKGAGWDETKIIWTGSIDANMVECLSLSGATITNLTLDGNSVSGVTGMHYTTGESYPSQHTEFHNLLIKNCPADGLVLEQDDSPAPMDYLNFYNATLYNNGVNLRVKGGPRQVNFYSGAILNAETYGIVIEAGVVKGWDLFFGLNGYDFVAEEQLGSDIYIKGEIASVQMYGGGSESLVILDGDWDNDAGWSRLLAPNIFSGFNQAPHSLTGGEAAISTSMTYDCARPLILTGCKHMGDVFLGDRVQVVQSNMTDFYNYDRREGEPNEIEGFVNHPDRVNLLGRCDTSDGTGFLSATTLLANRVMVAPDAWLPGLDLIEATTGSVWKRLGFAVSEPDTYYARAGWIFLNSGAGADTPLGWVCTSAGDGASETTKAEFMAFGEGLVGSVFGSMSEQDANNVAITGGSVSGVDYSVLEINAAAPMLQFNETDQSAPNGIWRVVADGNEWRVDRNTHENGDFTSYQSQIVLMEDGELRLFNKETLLDLESFGRDFVIDGQGSVIVAGIKGDIELPFDGTITSVRLLADQSGSIVVDIWKDTYANFPPTDADSITASAVPEISSAVKSEDTTLSGWTTTFDAGDILRINVDSATTVERVTLSIRGIKG